MASQASRKRAYEPPAIPDRLYFKIGDVADLCGVETYVLRFWESQFPQLKPNKSGTGQRLYRRRDVEMALEVKRLVHAEGYTIAGARTVLEQGARKHGSKLNGAAALPAGADPRGVRIAVSVVTPECRGTLKSRIFLRARSAVVSRCRRSAN